MRILAAVAPFLLALSLAAQEPVDRGMVDRIEAEATEHSGVMEGFDHLTNVIGPRLTGSPALKRAAGWAADELRAMGMTNVHEETFDFGRGWTLEGLTLEMTRPCCFPLVGYPEAWTPSTAGALEGSPVYVGDWSEEQVRARASELRGRIVLPYRPMEAFITMDREQPTDHDAPVRIGAPPFLRPSAPVDRRALPDLLRDVGAGVMLAPNQGTEGTLFVLGDTGATDNADGVASAMEAMRILKALGVRPRRTIRLALWSGDGAREAAIVPATFLHHAAMRDAKIPRAPVS
jgi:hypothetical protein